MLAVIEHEIGHLLGYDHTSSGLMADMLAARVHVTPMNVVEQVFASA